MATPVRGSITTNSSTVVYWHRERSQSMHYAGPSRGIQFKQCLSDTLISGCCSLGVVLGRRLLFGSTRCSAIQQCFGSLSGLRRSAAGKWYNPDPL